MADCNRVMKKETEYLVDILGKERTVVSQDGTEKKAKFYIAVNTNTKTAKDNFLNSLEKETLIYPVYYGKAGLDCTIQNNDTFFIGGRKLTVRGLGFLLAGSEPYGVYFYAW